MTTELEKLALACRGTTSSEQAFQMIYLKSPAFVYIGDSTTATEVESSGSLSILYSPSTHVYTFVLSASLVWENGQETMSRRMVFLLRDNWVIVDEHSPMDFLTVALLRNGEGSLVHINMRVAPRYIELRFEQPVDLDDIFNMQLTHTTVMPAGSMVLQQIEPPHEEVAAK